jgi:hypothetical protein
MLILMAKWQKVYLHRLTAEAVASRQNTIIVDLPEKDFLSQILVKVHTLNPAIVNAIMPISHFVRRLEVIDGSDVLYSLSGQEAQAMAYYRGRTNVNPAGLQWSATDAYDMFYIRFNRFNGDTKYLVNLSKLSNPQLRITYDNTVATIEGRLYDVNPNTPTVRYTVVCDILRGTPPSNYTGKFISSREVYNWNYVATGTEFIDIPRTDPIYGIGIRACYIACRSDTFFDRIRLNINNQEWIPFDIFYSELEQLHREWFSPECQSNYRAHIVGRQRTDTGLGSIEKNVQITKRSWTVLACEVDGTNGGWLVLAVTDLAVPTETLVPDQWYVTITGLFPQHMAYLPMSVVTDTPEETLDAPSCANILLEVTSLATNVLAFGQVVVDVVRDEGR